MRRTLAFALAGAAIAFVPSGPASAAPDCDVAQNCLCSTVDGALYLATGSHWLDCA